MPKTNPDDEQMEFDMPTQYVRRTYQIPPQSMQRGIGMDFSERMHALTNSKPVSQEEIDKISDGLLKIATDLDPESVVCVSCGDTVPRSQADLQTGYTDDPVWICLECLKHDADQNRDY